MKYFMALIGLGFSVGAFACTSEQVGLQTPPGFPPEATISFLNQTADPMTIYWVNYEGGLEAYAEVAPGENYPQPSFENHVWVVSDSAGNCFGPFSAAPEADPVVIQ